jgi:hypothetical protein
VHIFWSVLYGVASGSRLKKDLAPFKNAGVHKVGYALKVWQVYSLNALLWNVTKNLHCISKEHTLKQAREEYSPSYSLTSRLFGFSLDGFIDSKQAKS